MVHAQDPRPGLVHRLLPARPPPDDWNKNVPVDNTSHVPVRVGACLRDCETLYIVYPGWPIPTLYIYWRGVGVTRDSRVTLDETHNLLCRLISYDIAKILKCLNVDSLLIYYYYYYYRDV